MSYKTTKRIPLVTAGIKINSKLYKDIWALAEKDKVTFSEIARRALSEYVKKFE